MKVTPTALPEVLLIEPRVFGDDRGFFYESYNRRALAEAGLTADFVQDNHSRSRRGVLRGLHYQIEHAQGKLVRAVTVEVFDVAVDLRRSSPNFGKSVTVVLSAANKRMLWVPPGFAHGFCTLTPDTEVAYKVSAPYTPACDRGLALTDSLGAYMLSGRQLTIVATNALYTSDYQKTRAWMDTMRQRAVGDMGAPRNAVDGVS